LSLEFSNFSFSTKFISCVPLQENFNFPLT
jgi:hypothetical protein